MAESSPENVGERADQSPRILRFVVLAMVLVALSAVAIVAGFGPRAPLRRDHLIATGLAVAVIGVGASLLLRFINPRLRRLESHATDLREARHGPTSLARQVEERAHEPEESRLILETLVHNLPGMVYRSSISDEPGWPLEFASAGARELTGYDPSELVHGSIDYGSDIVHPDDRARACESVRAALARNEPFRISYRILRRDGEERAVLDQGALRRADPPCIEGFIQDLSREQKAVEELSANEARFRRLTDSAPVMVFLTDAQGQSIYVNPMWHRITGLPADAAFGTGWLRAVHPEDRPRLESDWAETFSAGRDVASLPDARFQTPEGKISWLGGTVVALRDAAGELTGYLGMLTDLTERRRVDEELHKIEGRAHEAEKLASISVLTSRIAHDIGAPLTAILGYAELMQKSITDEKNRKRATIIVEQVNRISKLIQALLDMTRSGERPHIAIDLAPLLDKSLDFFRESLRKHAIEVERIYEVSPRIPADPDRFQQALLSLVMHAIDAMPRGGTLRISLTSPDPAHVEIRIADTGDGIAPEMLSGIFDPLMTTRPLGNAKGLGLVVARNIVEEHAGALSVSSTVGKGTEFTIRFGIDPG